MELETLVRQAVDGDRAAAEQLVAAIQDDVYRLAFRMLGLRADAEDATQEILIKVLTNLGTFRGESSFRTWFWRVAAHHVLRAKRSRREEVASFETIEQLIAAGDANPPMPGLSPPELALMADEVRLSCTQAMVMSLDRPHRMSWILAEVFELSGEEAAAVLEIDPATYRKRLSRSRERLAEWMKPRCGLADAANACRCTRQVPAAMAFGVAVPGALEYADHPARPSRTRLAIVEEAAEIEAAAAALKEHPDYAAPPALLQRIRAIIDSGRYRMFDA